MAKISKNFFSTSKNYLVLKFKLIDRLKCFSAICHVIRLKFFMIIFSSKILVLRVSTPTRVLDNFYAAITQLRVMYQWVIKSFIKDL